MNPRHAAALALMGWCLMAPPTWVYPINANVLDPNSRVQVNLNAPLAWWFNYGEYSSRSNCEVDRIRQIREVVKLEDNFPKTKLPNELIGIEEVDKHLLCVASDDPRLKEK